MTINAIKSYPSGPFLYFPCRTILHMVKNRSRKPSIVGYVNKNNENIRSAVIVFRHTGHFISYINRGMERNQPHTTNVGVTNKINVMQIVFSPELYHHQVTSIEHNLFLYSSTKLLESLSRWFVSPAIFPL